MEGKYYVLKAVQSDINIFNNIYVSDKLSEIKMYKAIYQKVLKTYSKMQIKLSEKPDNFEEMKNKKYISKIKKYTDILNDIEDKYDFLFFKHDSFDICELFDDLSDEEIEELKIPCNEIEIETFTIKEIIPDKKNKYIAYISTILSSLFNSLFITLTIFFIYKYILLKNPIEIPKETYPLFIIIFIILFNNIKFYLSGFDLIHNVVLKKE